jgi:hypothetical protein
MMILALIAVCLLTIILAWVAYKKKPRIRTLAMIFVPAIFCLGLLVGILWANKKDHDLFDQYTRHLRILDEFGKMTELSNSIAIFESKYRFTKDLHNSITEVWKVSRPYRSYDELQREFFRREAELDGMRKEYLSRRNETLKDLLEISDPKVSEECWARLNKPLELTSVNFDGILSQVFAENLLAKGDMPSLKHLLSVNCPDYVALRPVEFYLAQEKGTKAISILINAYAAAGTNTSSTTIINSLKRALPMLVVKGESDVAFVKKCEKWKSSFTPVRINYMYPYLPSLPVSPKSLPPEESALFVSAYYIGN